MPKNSTLRIIFFSFLLFILITSTSPVQVNAQSKIKSVPFAYIPDANPDLFSQRIQQKALLANDGTIILISKKTEQAYTVESYSPDLKKLWEAPVSLAVGEDLENFTLNDKNIIVLTYRKSASNQAITGQLVDMKTGKKTESIKLLEVQAGGRRLATALSTDGSKLVAYQYIYQLDQLKSINAHVFDGSLTKIKDRTYDFRDLQGIASATVRIDDAGNQYAALVINKGTKLTVRRYNNTNNEIKGMDVQVGGVFEGKNVYVLDYKFQLEQDGNVYGAAICADEKTGDYHSLKVIRFDFAAGDMKYAPEFRFTPQYVAALNKALGVTTIKRLEDIMLSELIISPEKNVVVLAEKKYQEGPKLPYVAKEMHLFAYNEFMNPTWHSVINKTQTAPATEGFAGISYKAKLFNEQLHVITAENLNGKPDIYSRSINIKNGLATAPKPAGLGLIMNQGPVYIKDFTLWLDDRNIITLAKPAKKTSLQLNKLTFK